MDAITYSLLKGNMTSNQYYRQIKLFAARVSEELDTSVSEYISYMTYINVNSIEEPMSKKIYLFEFLVLGVLWNSYIDRALTLNSFAGNMLEKMVSLRSKKGFKGIMDFSRGFLGTVFLVNKKNEKDNIRYSLNNLVRMIHWLKASGEFRFIDNRLDNWFNYLKSLSTKKVERLLTHASQLGFWFEEKSNEVLGTFTPNVDAFIEKNDKKLKWKEHRVFCTKKRVEYHLNMVGAEIMNEAFRENFLKTKEKRVLLPICMRAKSNQECKAVKTKDGFTCTGCTNKCMVNEITKLGHHNNFKVFIIPHASSAFSDMKVEKGNVGIVGVACVLNLISGGYQAKALGFEPQCVLLDFCGCKKYWHKKGLETRINLESLKSILNL